MYVILPNLNATCNAFGAVLSALTLLVGCQEHPACKKFELCVAGVVISKERGADNLHCHPIIFCFIKILEWFTFLVPAYPGCPGKSGSSSSLNIKCTLHKMTPLFC